MSAVSLYYYLQVLKRVYVMPAVDETPIAGHPITMGVLILIALAVLIFGCFPRCCSRGSRDSETGVHAPPGIL